MEVKLAKCAGFCFGVKRAIDTVHEQIGTGKTIYTYGPIVHNEEVVNRLEQQGVRVIEGREELRAVRGDGTVIIRAHGVPRETQELMEQSGLECIDATCPFVKRIHRIVEKAGREGQHVVIAGNPGHPEVEGIKGWCNGPVTVLETEEEARKFQPDDGRKVCLIAQTTFNYNKFQSIVEIFCKKGYNDNIVNTICNATEERQRSARELAAEADVMIVIGGKHSSNSRKLYEICSRECAHTYFIQTLDDLHLELPKAVRLVGITAGASTPNNLIEEVQNYVRINF
ncbi:MAG: 4-hydroxy-3-methylbut-2-enyl diphosphate reductase [Clostridium sp.]|nr:4-hydroxy-3-methylbut-2-enyl diphosphate reductase [Acetatifactor muris]MCM1527156.1 4-hydroxy-3-methylbut-2-enyl diphosphate reductase [Bacteroides sp.]MCM1562519.1 4-hydroxy-3-methylbut-2-enyl diphosphate reductase [Clostridium sp.]